MNLSQDDILELLQLLNVSLYDANEHVRLAAPEDRPGEEAHREKIRTWIHRLSQHIGQE